MTDLSSLHVPILAKEVIKLLVCQPGGVYIDATLGGGGHAKMILNASMPDSFLIGIDRDYSALKIARETLKDFGERVKFIHGNFKELKQICHTHNISEVTGILMDLGMSSDQLEGNHRGFSFKYPDDPLDMRMDETIGLTASYVLNQFGEKRLLGILTQLGEERWAASIAREIVATRKIAPFRQVKDLVSAIKRAIPSKARHGRLHMATRTFQALRIFVNQELEALAEGLHAGLSLLSPKGRMVVISFHSLEDRVVKQTFSEAKKNPEIYGSKSFSVLTRHPIRPTREEVRNNPRARSAKLRAVERSIP